MVGSTRSKVIFYFFPVQPLFVLKGHIKAGIHAAANDQDNFERTLQQANEATSHTPVLGHVKAGMHQAAGDFGQAHETLEKANTVTDHVPILGHIKAGVHEAAGLGLQQLKHVCTGALHLLD